MRLNRFGIAVAATIGLAHSQSTTAAWPKFEVAAIKPCKNLQPGARGGSGNSSPGRLNLNCQTVAGLIRFAYGLFANGRFNSPPIPPISGGPAWIDSEHYTIDAKADSKAGPEAMQGPMLQVLLEDRFHLKIRHENREVPAYALTVAKGGLKLQRFKRRKLHSRRLHQATRAWPP